MQNKFTGVKKWPTISKPMSHIFHKHTHTYKNCVFMYMCRVPNISLFYMLNLAAGSTPEVFALNYYSRDPSSLMA